MARTEEISTEQYLPGGSCQRSDLDVRLVNFSCKSPLPCMAEPETNQLNRS
jgi:hypothetical protein